VISGTGSSWYQEPEQSLNIYANDEIGAPNLSNKVSFGFLLTEPACNRAVWNSTKKARITIAALVDRKSRISKTTLSLHPFGRSAGQRLRVVAVDADRQGREGKDWLDGSDQRTRGRPPALVGVTGPIPDALEIARRVGHVVIDGFPRLEMTMRSMPRVADGVARPVPPWPSDEADSDETQKPQVKSRIFPSDLRARFILDRRRPRASIAPDRPEALADCELATTCSRIDPRVALADAPHSSQLVSATHQRRCVARADAHARCRHRAHGALPARAHEPSLGGRRGCSGAGVARWTSSSSVAALAKRFTCDSQSTSRPICASTSRSQRSCAGRRSPRRASCAREFPQTQRGKSDGRSHRG